MKEYRNVCVALFKIEKCGYLEDIPTNVLIVKMAALLLGTMHPNEAIRW